MSAAGSRLRLRAGRAGDAAGMLALKARLRLRGELAAGEASARGGFLLGSTAAQYEALIAEAQVDVLLDGEALVGFVTALPDAALRASELWRRREQVDGREGTAAMLAAIEGLRLGYVDQLAVAPEPAYRLLAPVLAYRGVARLLAAGSELVLTTVVARPVRNLATLPLLGAVSAQRVGTIVERYPEVGEVSSDVFCVSAAAFTPSGPREQARLAALRRWCERLLEDAPRELIPWG